MDGSDDRAVVFGDGDGTSPTGGASVMAERGTHRRPDGARLATYRWLPRERPLALVYLLHGMLEHAGRYAATAEYLVARGYGVYAHDHRGHGRSAHPDGGPVGVGHIAGEGGARLLVDDAEARLAEVAADNPGLPVALVGHSMGSFVAREVAMRQGRRAPRGTGGAKGAGAGEGLSADVDAFVLVGTSGPQPLLSALGPAFLRALERTQGPEHPSKLARRLMFGTYNAHFRPTRTANDWLCHDPAVVDEYEADPLCAPEASVAFWRDVAELMGRVNDRALLGLAEGPRHVAEGLFRGMPMLFLSGRDDGVGQFGPGPKRAAALAREAGSTDVTCTLFADRRHEILNIGDPLVLSALVGWLDARLGIERGSMTSGR